MKIYHYTVITFVCALFFGSALLPLIDRAASVPASATVNNLPVIVVDAGHGGLDGGAVGEGGIIEKEVNLDICLNLRDMLVAGGFEVVMTRDSDISIHDEGIEGTRKQKTSDLHNRLNIVNSRQDAIFISIHQNKFGNKSSHGAQMFFSPNSPESEVIAEFIQKAFVENLQPDNERLIKKAGKNLYLMYNVQCPAVLIECGFVSNPDEASRLMSEEYRCQIAFTIYTSLMRYLGMEASGSELEAS